jgi:hypothetical protein
MTSLSISSPSSPDPAGLAVIACGALAQDVARVAASHGWAVDVYPLPPLLHNHPQRIAPEVAALARDLCTRYRNVAVAYADCGTYGALDEVCAELDVPRLGGEHCYDVIAGAEQMRELLDREPGTYVLTDFLVRSFRRSVIAELGLDRYPDLRDDYFGHYRRVVWLAQRPTPELTEQAREAAELLGLPLEVVHVGDERLARQLQRLVAASQRTRTPAAWEGGSASPHPSTQLSTVDGPTAAS